MQYGICNYNERCFNYPGLKAEDEIGGKASGFWLEHSLKQPDISKLNRLDNKNIYAVRFLVKGGKIIMKKRIVAVLLAAVMCGLSATASVQAGGDGGDYQDNNDLIDDDLEGEDLDTDYETDPDPDVMEANTLIPEDLRVSPAKKTVYKGDVFDIQIVAAGGSEFDDLSEEEWYDIRERSIDSIAFRSTKSNVAYVSRTGRVRARRRGSAVIKTTINLSNGDSVTFKTKVYVKK